MMNYTRADLVCLEEIKLAWANVGPQPRSSLIRRAIHLAGLIARLKLSGIVHFGYVDRDGKFQHLPTLFL